MSTKEQRERFDRWWSQRSVDFDSKWEAAEAAFCDNEAATVERCVHLVDQFPPGQNVSIRRSEIVAALRELKGE